MGEKSIFELIESRLNAMHNTGANGLDNDLSDMLQAEYERRNGELSKKERGLIREYLLNDYTASLESAESELSEAQRKIPKSKGNADEKRQESLYRASQLIRRAKKDLRMHIEFFPEKEALDMPDEPKELLQKLDDMLVEVHSTWEYCGYHEKIATLIQEIRHASKYGHEDEVAYMMQALNRLVREPMPKWDTLDILINSMGKNNPKYLPENFGDMIINEFELRKGSLTYDQKLLIQDYFSDDYRKAKDAVKASMRIASVLGSDHGNYQDSLYKALSLANRAMKDLKRIRVVFPKSEKLSNTEETYEEAMLHLENTRKEILRLFDNPSVNSYNSGL